jgi:hypothetical protein
MFTKAVMDTDIFVSYLGIFVLDAFLGTISLHSITIRQTIHEMNIG